MSASRKASLPERKSRTRWLLPFVFVSCGAVGSALGLASTGGLEGLSAPKVAKDPSVADVTHVSTTPRGAEPEDYPVVDASAAGSRAPFTRLNPETSVGRAWLLAEGPEPQAGDGRRYVTFTFDDGPFVETTPAILRVLEQRKVKAAFFVVSQYLEGHDRRAERTRELLRDIVARGHLVGNHTKDHKNLSTVSRAEAVSQIDDGAALIEETLGKKPLLFRPPYGELDGFGRELLHARGQELVLWSIEAADMKNDDPDAMAKNLRRQIDLNQGGIVLLHDIRPTTLPTLKKVLEHLHQKRWDPAHPERIGYQIVDLPTYFALTEASPRPYANREALENARHEAFRRKHPDWRPPEPSAPSEGATEGAGQTADDELRL
jgi:peptidoglycan/xylan/chitin deacetylase (PgdA/CDA1 family)